MQTNTEDFSLAKLSPTFRHSAMNALRGSTMKSKLSSTCTAHYRMALFKEESLPSIVLLQKKYFLPANDATMRHQTNASSKVNNNLSKFEMVSKVLRKIIAWPTRKPILYTRPNSSQEKDQSFETLSSPYIILAKGYFQA